MNEVISYQCPSCGATLSFSSAAQKMSCASCGNRFDLETVQQYDALLKQSQGGEELDWAAYEADSGSGDWRADEQEELVLASCPSCGGEIMGDRQTAATSCPYCGNATILPRQLAGVYRPDLVIPFKIDKEQAQAALRHYCKRKPLLPKQFTERRQIEQMKGVYAPFWLYDCQAHANITYRAARLAFWSDANFDYTKTDHFLLQREGDISFEKVPVDGSSKMDDAYMEALEPYDYSATMDFSTAYLSGYLADKYDQDAEACAPRANQRITSSTKTAFNSTVSHYSSAVPQHSHIQLQRGDIRYALLPVWLMNASYHGKTYAYAINGQTGKLVGELPISRARFWAWFCGIFAALAVPLSIIFYFL